jgi:hypothetical protein
MDMGRWWNALDKVKDECLEKKKYSAAALQSGRQETCVQRNNETHSCNNCRGGKAVLRILTAWL